MRTRTVTGKWTTPEVKSPRGEVVFTTSTRVKYLDENHTLVPNLVKIALDDTGSISVDLPVTNDINSEPADWVWNVVENIKGQPASHWAFQLPYEVASIDLTDLSPVEYQPTPDSHATSTGSSHTWLDQDMTKGAAPELDGTNFTNLPGGGGVTTLSVGTVTSTTVGITSDGGVDDVIIPAASSADAGLLSGADFDEIAANSAHSSGDGSDHTDVASNTVHSGGDGSDHTGVAVNTTHRGLSNNPHLVTPAQVQTGMNDIVDATITSVQDGHILEWDVDAWKNVVNSGGTPGTDLGWINVMDEGATGDGSTDDTTAIQDALDKAPGVVYFPPGNYRISAPLQPEAYTQIIGSESSSRYWAYATSVPPSVCSVEVMDTFSGSAVWDFQTDSVGISMQNLTTLGRNVGTVDGMDWTAGGENNFVMERCAIIGMGGDGVYGQLWAARFHMVFIGGCHGWGMNADTRFADVHVSESFIAGNKLGGLKLAGSSSSGLCSFVGVRFERSGYDNVDASHYSNANSPGIYLDHANDCRFVSCDTDANTGSGVELVSDTGVNVYNILFTSCHFRRDGAGDFTALPEHAGVRIYGTTGGTVERVSFTDCVVVRAKSSDAGSFPSYEHPKYGLWSEDTSHLRVTGGRYHSTTQDLYAGGVGFEVENYRPQIIIPESKMLATPQGATADRPADPIAGCQFWDRTLDLWVVWDGSAWLVMLDLAAFQTVTAASSDFSDFQTRVAAL